MENEKNDGVILATEEQTTPVAFSDWTQKLRFDRSFTAKLVLSEEKLKGFYAELATALLRYERVRSHTGWSGVSFSLGRDRIAYIAITGKTLCFYFAVQPEDVLSTRYRAKDVSDVKKRAKTPSLLKIKSEGAKNHALKLIEEFAQKAHLTPRTEGNGDVSLAAFKSDSFQNLITRGLIRIVRNNSTSGGVKSGIAKAKRCGAYADTVDTMEELTERHGIYNEILGALAEGDGKMRLSQKQMLRSVDELWVRAIEDCISSLDELIRNPNHFIAESEEVLPIEKTKRISGRSIAHLCRHTDYISVKEGGEITPTKMLNVFREDSLLTYENKFLNTLINRLYTFVDRRFKVAKEYGADEKLESFTYENTFTHGEGKGKIKISVEYAERNLNGDVKNALLGTGLWERVERLHNIVTGYVNSAFAKSMERNFVHPPILRTNAILKNKYFRECLALWEFIESYDDAGYGITVEEKTKEISDDYVKAAYAGASMQYLLFRHALEDGFDEESEQFDVLPNFVYSEPQSENYEEELAFADEEEEIDEDVTFALRVALAADEQMQEFEDESDTFLQKTFHAKLRMADEELKEILALLGNEILRYARVKMRQSRKYAAFYYGRKPLLKITVSGKALKAYFALNAADVPEKYHAKDVSEIKTFADTPVCVRVKSKRSVKYAKEMLDLLAIEYGLHVSKKPTEKIDAADYARETLADMLQKGWISFAKKKRFSQGGVGEISFGPAKQPHVETYAQAVRALAVAESTTKAETLAVEANAAKGGVEPSEESQRLANQIAGLIRPSGNYEKPTEYGIDDASGFILDEQTEKDGEPL